MIVSPQYKFAIIDEQKVKILLISIHVGNDVCIFPNMAYQTRQFDADVNSSLE